MHVSVCSCCSGEVMTAITRGLGKQTHAFSGTRHVMWAYVLLYAGSTDTVCFVICLLSGGAGPHTLSECNVMLFVCMYVFMWLLCVIYIVNFHQGHQPKSSGLIVHFDEEFGEVVFSAVFSYPISPGKRMGLFLRQLNSCFCIYAAFRDKLM